MTRSNDAMTIAELDVAAARLAALPGSRLHALDRSMRARGGDLPFALTAWWQIEPRDVAALGRHCSRPAAAFALFAMHRSGFVREAAVRELDVSSDPIALPFLLLRAVDWVDGVRRAATAAIERRRATGGAEGWVELLPLLQALAEEFARGRAYAGEVHRWVVEGIADERLIELVGSADRALRRAAARALAAKASIGDALSRALAVALRQDDLTVARIVVQRLQERGRFASADLLAMGRSRYAPIRALALAGLETLETLEGPEVESAWLASLRDSSASVRRTAQHHWKSRGRDLAAFYAALLASEPALALRGLGEVDALKDLGQIEPCLTAKGAQARAVAVKALGRLGGREVAERLVAFVDDVSPRVARAGLHRDRSGREGPAAARRLSRPVESIVHASRAVRVRGASPAAAGGISAPSEAHGKARRLLRAAVPRVDLGPAPP